MPTPSGPRIIPLSARSEQALAAIRSRLADHLEQTPGLRLDDVATTLQTGRETFAHRCAVVVSDTRHAAQALRGTAPLTVGQADTQSACRVVWSFGGLDTATATTTDTAARAFAGSPAVRTWARAANLENGLDGTGAVELFVAQLGLVEELAGRGVVPDAVTGAGAGLVAALVASGALDFPRGLQLAAALAAPGADARSVTALLERLSPGPAWRSLPGTGADLSALAEALLAADGRTPPPAREHGGRTVVVDTGVGARATATATATATVVRLIDDADTDTDSTAPRVQVLTGVARLWCHGVPVELAEGVPGRRLRLPGYRFERLG